MKHFFVFFISILLFFSFSFPTKAQKEWEFAFKRQKRTSIPFRLINNLIIIKMRINNSTPLNFIVDTGLKATLITELTYGDSITLNFAEEISLKGLGGNEEIKALSTRDNTIRIGSLTGKNQEVLVLMDNIFHLSEKLGIKVHGIIGYELFKDHVIVVNYSTKRLKIYKPEKYKYKKKKKQMTFPLIWHRYKPYMNVNVMVSDTGEIIPMHMLIDTGSSDAIWIFKESTKNVYIPKPNIRAYLGHGLSGEVYGYKARINDIKVGNISLKEPVASFPDSSDLSIAFNYMLRNGSIGGEVLKRFNIIFDYPKSKITLKPNSFVKKPFYFNGSGIELSNPFPGMPVYVIADIRKGSPAEKAGLKPGDQILNLNSKSAFEYSLQEIQNFFAEQKKRNIRLKITRDGKDHVIQIQLNKVL